MYIRLAILRMRQKRILRIELSRGRGGSVYVSVSPSDCVLSIKHELETLTGIPTLSQTLYYAATPLSDSTPLHEFCHTAPVPTLSLHVPIRGGACNQSSKLFDSIKFYDVTNENCFETNEFSYSAPDYRRVCKGINLQAECNNPRCTSVRRSDVVIVQIGMCTNKGGYCSIRRAVTEMICPACNYEIPSRNWRNILFTNCTATIDWALACNEKIKGSVELIVSSKNYKQAKTSCEMKEYAYLDVGVK